MKKIKSIKIIPALLFVSVITIGMFVHGCSPDKSKEVCISTTPSDSCSEELNTMSYAGLGAFDSVLYENGKRVFKHKCTHCHDMDKKMKGPALRGITKRHSAKWVENLLVSLQKLAQADSLVTHVYENNKEVNDGNATKPLYMPLTNDDERRALLEFLRKEG